MSCGRWTLSLSLSGSIEDAKQKAEHDRRVKQAEMKKHSVKKEVGRLRHAFQQLVQRNAKLPPSLQLAADEFTMDPGLEAGMREKAEQQVLWSPQSASDLPPSPRWSW